MEEEGVSCRQCCREEFRCANFGLGYKYPAHFVTSQCGNVLLYPVWTIFRFMYYLAFVIAMIIIDSENDKLPDNLWFIFFTNWGYFLLNIAFLWDFIVTQYLHVTKSKILDGTESRMPWYLMIDWLLFNIKNGMGIVITLGYYGFLTVEWKAASTEKHLINTVMILLDFFLSSKPVRLLHFYQPVIPMIFYLIFSLIYQKTGNGLIYPDLDWDNIPSTLVFIFGFCVIGIPLIHSILFGLYHLRLAIHRAVCPRRVVGNANANDIEFQKY